MYVCILLLFYFFEVSFLFLKLWSCEFNHLYLIYFLSPIGGGVGGRLKKKPARAGWPRRLALVRATSRAEVDVIGVQRC